MSRGLWYRRRNLASQLPTQTPSSTHITRWSTHLGRFLGNGIQQLRHGDPTTSITFCFSQPPTKFCPHADSTENSLGLLAIRGGRSTSYSRTTDVSLELHRCRGGIARRQLSCRTVQIPCLTTPSLSSWCIGMALGRDQLLL